MVLWRSHNGEYSSPISASRSPCLKNSSMHLDVHWWCTPHLLAGCDTSQECKRRQSTFVLSKLKRRRHLSVRTQALQRIRTRPTCTHDSLKLLPGVGSGGGDETAVLQLAPLFARVAVGIPDDGGGHLGNVKSGRKRERKKRTNKQKRLKEVPRRRAPREVKQHKKAVPF